MYTTITHKVSPQAQLSLKTHAQTQCHHQWRTRGLGVKAADIRLSQSQQNHFWFLQPTHCWLHFHISKFTRFTIEQGLTMPLWLFPTLSSRALLEEERTWGCVWGSAERIGSAASRFDRSTRWLIKLKVQSCSCWVLTRCFLRLPGIHQSCLPLSISTMERYSQAHPLGTKRVLLGRSVSRLVYWFELGLFK